MAFTASAADPMKLFIFVSQFSLLTLHVCYIKKNSLIIENDLAYKLKMEKFFIRKEKKFYRIGYILQFQF